MEENDVDVSDVVLVFRSRDQLFPDGIAEEGLPVRFAGGHIVEAGHIHEVGHMGAVENGGVEDSVEAEAVEEGDLSALVEHPDFAGKVFFGGSFVAAQFIDALVAGALEGVGDGMAGHVGEGLQENGLHAKIGWVVPDGVEVVLAVGLVLGVFFEALRQGGQLFHCFCGYEDVDLTNSRGVVADGFEDSYAGESEAVHRGDECRLKKFFHSGLLVRIFQLIDADGIVFLFGRVCERAGDHGEEEGNGKEFFHDLEQFGYDKCRQLKCFNKNLKDFNTEYQSISRFLQPPDRSMRYLIFSLVAFLLLFSLQSNAQQFLTGKVFKKNSTEALVSVSIHNISAQRYDLSEESGSYRIQVVPGDHVSFSSVGYMADTVTVTAAMLTGDFPVYLDVRAQTLKAVRVGEFSNYQLDSMDRRKEYAWVYDHGNTPRMEHERKGDGVGVTLNIFRNASAKEKQRERLEKRLAKEEEEYYIDSRYNKDLVTKITRLKADSLQQFMTKYRPSFDYCRRAANVDILVYINDSYKQYVKGD